MTDDEALTQQERQDYIARYGEYRRFPIVSYGPFRIDRERHRHFSFPSGERDTLWYHLVFMLDAASEFDLMGSEMHMYRRWGGTPIAGWPVPSRAEVLQMVHDWLPIWRPGGAQSALVCNRRRVGPPTDGTTATTTLPGDWYIAQHFRRPGAPMITMAEATPQVEVALRALEHAETSDGVPG